MHELDLLLRILTAANASTPALVALIQSIRSGRAAGKTDEQIQADSMQLALETRDITARDMAGPNAPEDDGDPTGGETTGVGGGPK